VDLLLRNYRVRRQGTGTVAGRRVVELVIEPRHQGNPTKRVWIDPTCRMALREEVRDSQGRLLAASEFERFEQVRELPAGLFEPPSSSTEWTPPSALPFSPLRPRYVPPGYQEVRRAAARRGPFQGVHLRYTDGLGTISLFQFRSDGSTNGYSQRRHRGRNGGHRKPPSLNRRIGELECRVMGDTAGAELRKMLDSLSTLP
jgi:negative regulator of sigma E activity